MELLLNMTIGGTAVACVILVVKLLLKNRLTPKWHVYIWLILAVRLLIPGLPESDYSLMNTIPSAHNFTVAEDTKESIVSESSTDKETGRSAAVRKVEGNISVKSPLSGIKHNREFAIQEQKVSVLFILWLAGAITLFVYFTVIYFYVKRKAKMLPRCKDADILRVFTECRRNAGVKSDRIDLRIGGNTPMTFGVFCPVLMIPEGYTKDELKLVLLHELCHLKHRDVLINFLCCTLLCVYWYNPVLWYCFFTVRKDVEILRDEEVIQLTGERKQYAKTLLKTAMKENRILIAATAMQNGEKEVSQRIRHIANFNRPRTWVSVIAILAVLFIGAACLTDASAIDTVNVEVGEGYFLKIPQGWLDGQGYLTGGSENGSLESELIFTGEDSSHFGGASLMQVEPGDLEPEKIELLLPSHSKVKERSVLEDENRTFIIVNLNMGTKPDQNQNHIFILPKDRSNMVFNIWADGRSVPEKELLRVAKSFQEDPYPQGYQPEAPYYKNWTVTAEKLLDLYFKNYVNTDIPVSSDISGYQIDHLKPMDEQELSWSLVIHPNIAVYRVDYTLDTAYPDSYSFTGGDFEIGSGNKTKIYKDQLAVFRQDQRGMARFLGFVWTQGRSELGDVDAILSMVNYTDPNLSPAACRELKTPYIGDASKVGRIIGSMPLAQYSKGMELHTDGEPYGLTVNYDLTELGSIVFESDPEREKTDSRGWELNPYLSAQLYKNSAILLSLIDNCSTVEFNIHGLAEEGIPYTYSYQTDRDTLTRELLKDPRDFTETPLDYENFFRLIEESWENTNAINDVKKGV